MSVIRETLDRYSKMALGGWCCSGNCTVRKDGYEPLDLEDTVAVKNYMLKHIDNWDHMKADACLIGFGNYKAYSDSGCELPTMLPTFVRVNDEKFLRELCFDRRDQEIEKGVVDLELTRFDLMDPVEEGEEL